jgi:hypothetical protein
VERTPSRADTLLGRYVVLERRTFAALVATTCLLACGGAAPRGAATPSHEVAAVDDPDAAPTPTAADLQILRRADALLSDPSRWNHGGDRECVADAPSWNLYCVLHRASLDVTGSFQHRSAAMQEVRWVVDDRTRGMTLEHRLMGYNNLPTTSFADIKAVLAEAARRLEAKLAPK